MVDRLTKFVRRLGNRQALRIAKIADDIKVGKLKGLDVKPMKGKKGWYRCRVGKVRIIFIKIPSQANVIHDINFRGGAYKK